MNCFPGFISNYAKGLGAGKRFSPREPGRISVRVRFLQERSPRASMLSEVGPALFLLFIFAVFPIIDIVFLGVNYGACSTLNSLQLREAAKVPKSQAIGIAATIQDNWKATGLGHLASIDGEPAVAISYVDGEQTAIGFDVYVNVTTSFMVRPLLTIPFFAGIPGLGAPMKLSVSGQRLMENPHYAAE